MKSNGKKYISEVMFLDRLYRYIKFLTYNMYNFALCHIITNKNVI